MTDAEKINWHINQAQRYNLAIADPECADYETIRLIRKHATWHLDMSDWLMTQPEKPPITELLSTLMTIQKNERDKKNGETETNTDNQDDAATGAEPEDPKAD